MLRWLAIGLLLTALWPCGANASEGTGQPTTSSPEGSKETPLLAGAPAGPSMASSTPLYNQMSYRGTVRRRRPLWYSFHFGAAERVGLDLTGETATCAVRITVIDARGRALANMISEAGESLPLVALSTAQSLDWVYYLRVDLDPYSRCRAGGYALQIVEPRQPGTCNALSGEGMPCPPSRPIRSGGVTRGQGGEQQLCSSWDLALQRASRAVYRIRPLVRRHRASIAALRRAEARRTNALINAHRACRF